MRRTSIRLSLPLAALPALALGCGDPADLAQDPQAADAPQASARVSGLRSEDPAVAVKDHYIVTLKPGKGRAAALNHVAAAPTFVYEHALNGFASYLTPGQAAALKGHPDVESIERDQIIQASTTQTPATWGLDRIDQRALPLNNAYNWVATATAVNAYVIDTGILPSHPEFGGRAQVAYDALGSNGVDCNGHGTHVAGTIGSASYGVAKGVNLRGVRVLDCSGSGTTAQVVAGIDWVRVNHVKPAVANLSLGGSFSSAINTAVTNLANAGVFVAVAAGNENQNACNVSPASAPAVYTVAASTSSDAKASFSNHGTCVDGYAPGQQITSTWLNNGTNTISGTSMASPHVAGLAALYKQFSDASQSVIGDWINANATQNVITGSPAGTPNRLIFTGASVPPVAPTACGEMKIGQGLLAAQQQALTACNGRYAVVMQADQNFVLYKSGGIPIWASGTYGRGVYAVSLQADGDLVEYGPTGALIWHSATGGNPGAVLKVQDDGNMVLYSKTGVALWATNTAGR